MTKNREVTDKEWASVFEVRHRLLLPVTWFGPNAVGAGVVCCTAGLWRQRWLSDYHCLVDQNQVRCPSRLVTHLAVHEVQHCAHHVNKITHMCHSSVGGLAPRPGQGGVWPHRRLPVEHRAVLHHLAAQFRGEHAAVIAADACRGTGPRRQAGCASHDQGQLVGLQAGIRWAVFHFKMLPLSASNRALRQHQASLGLQGGPRTFCWRPLAHAGGTW